MVTWPRPGEKELVFPPKTREDLLFRFRTLFIDLNVILTKTAGKFDFISFKQNSEYWGNTRSDSRLSTEPGLHKFVLRIDRNLAKKNLALGAFLDIVGAFDNIYTTFNSMVKSLRELKMLPVLIHWIDYMVKHRTVKVELYGITV